MTGFLRFGEKTGCFGCEACAQVCGKQAIRIEEDAEGFFYPQTDAEKCVDCGRCSTVCPALHPPRKYEGEPYVFGGYSRDPAIRFASTSGGAFSEIAAAFCDEDYVVFGAQAEGLRVSHQYITDIRFLDRFRKSKYSQSRIGESYREAKDFLLSGKKVLFSGTPCQIAGLKNFLSGTDCAKLLTVEVVCEGVPSPLYIRKYETAIKEKYGKSIASLDYRYTGKSLFFDGKWDFQVMQTTLTDGRTRTIDRWFNPFWRIWLDHLMSRPSCYACPFATEQRVADITLGDLWGVHLYCPDLYGKNGGSSLVIANSEQGKTVVRRAQEQMFGRALQFRDALRYQGPMRRHIAENPQRGALMADLQSGMSYKEINAKWASKTPIKFLLGKYFWGNRQKVFLWKITNGKYRIR